MKKGSNPSPPKGLKRPTPPPAPPRRISQDLSKTIDSARFRLEMYQAIAHGVAGTNADIADINVAVENCIKTIKDNI